MPIIQPISKALLANIRQTKHYIAQITACLKFWSSCEVSGNDSHLVELAHLHRKVGKDRSDAWFSVYHDCGKREAHRFQRVACALILVEGFALNLRPIDIDLFMRIAHYKIPRCPTKKNTVHDGDDICRNYDRGSKLIGAKLLAYPVNGAVIGFGKVFNNASLAHI